MALEGVLSLAFVGRCPLIEESCYEPCYDLFAPEWILKMPHDPGHCNVVFVLDILSRKYGKYVLLNVGSGSPLGHVRPRAVLPKTKQPAVSTVPLLLNISLA